MKRSRDCLRIFKDKPGKNDVLIPRLLSEMGGKVGLKIDERTVEKPFAGKRQYDSGT